MVERVAWSPSAHYRLVAGLLTAAVIARLLRRVSRVEVEGDSMRPTLHPGDRLVVLRGRRARPGDLVTVPDPRAPHRVVVKRVVVKRVVVKRVATGGEPGTGGMVVVRGDNPDASTDSRTFGPVPARSIQGRVVYRYFPEHRRGRPQR